MKLDLRASLRKFKVVRETAQQVRNIAGRYTQKAVFSNYLEGPGIKALNVGSSQRLLAGWLNTDASPAKGVTFFDATTPIPAPADSFDFIFGEHFIEHITYEQGRRFFLECFRVLKPGGVLRLATPDLEKVATLYEAPPTEAKQVYIKYYLSLWHPEVKGEGRAFIFDSLFRNFGHRFIYDRPTLKELAQSTGFTSVEFAEVGKSSFAPLQNLEFRREGPIAALNAFETMVMQATRPTAELTRGSGKKSPPGT